MAKSPAQLQREIDEALTRSHALTPRPEEVTSTAGLMAIASAVARQLRGTTWKDQHVRVSSSGTQVRFTTPSRYQGYPSDHECIVDLLLVGPSRSIMKTQPFAGAQGYDKKFGEAMEQRVRQVLAKGKR